MGQVTYPLGMPEDLLKEVRRAAKDTGLSVADVMRQAIKFGVPKVRQALTREEDSLADSGEKAKPAPKVRFVKRGRYTVGHTDKHVSLERIKELLAEFP